MIEMNSWKDLQNALLEFRNVRDWEQFHNPKDLALALSIEAAELNEVFLWKKSEEANPAKVEEELADVFAYAILLAEKYNLDINEIVLNKKHLGKRKSLTCLKDLAIILIPLKIYLML
jgi:NTP pyrophosphatase (non-canonical NTP hydrolase)